jgi:hypothetical protein
VEVASGTNAYVYLVCNQLGGPLAQLPAVTPAQVKASRRVKKLLTGRLGSAVSAYPLFPGTEANYLRALVGAGAAAGAAGAAFAAAAAACAGGCGCCVSCCCCGCGSTAPGGRPLLNLLLRLRTGQPGHTPATRAPDGRLAGVGSCHLA